MNKAPDLAICFGLLIVLIALVPLLAFVPGWLGPQLVTLAIAAMLLLLPGAAETDIQRSVAIFKPLAVAALVPAAWMLMQIIPVPLGSIENPVWRSAAVAMPDEVYGHVSIDLGYTLRGLFGYLSLISLAFVTAVLTRSRERAEIILFALCAITTFVALELFLFRYFSFQAPGRSPNDSTGSRVALAAFGVILNLGFIARATQRYDARDRRQPRAYAGMMSLGIVGVGVCLSALVYSTTYDILIAMAFGSMVVGVVVLIRRPSLGRWTAVTIGVAVVVAWGGLTALRFGANSSLSPLFRFAVVQSSEQGAAILRMISDANWAGGGVGSYQALAAMYRDSSGVPGDTAINTIAAMLLEWGSVGLLAAVVLGLRLLVVLLRGALSRGRDSFYASGAAACLVTAYCEAVCDTSFTEATVQMTAAIIVGLGLSQTAGRRAG